MAAVQVAQGIKKFSVMAKQTGLGVPVAGAGGQIMRRTTNIFTADRDTFDSPEIVSHQQSTGVSYGLKKVAGKLQNVYSCGTYKLILASLLRADFAATASIAAASITIGAAVAGIYPITRAAGSYLTDGAKIGDVVRLGVGALNVANANTNILIVALTGSVLSGYPLSGLALVPEGPITGCTISFPGKKTKAPLTGHTNDYFTVEEWASDISRSEVFSDVKWNKADIALPATGNSTIAADAIGLARLLGAAQVLTTPTAETTTSIMNASNGAIYAAGVVIANATGATISIDGNGKLGDAIIGSNSANDVARGKIKVTGTFVGLYSDAIISSLYDNETPTSLILVLTVDQTGTSDFATWTMGRIKILGDAPDDGEKQISRTYPFEAEININGGAALAWDQTILSHQDSAA